MVRVVVRLDDGAYNQLRVLAARRSVSVPRLALDLISAALGGEARRDGFSLDPRDRRRAREQLRDLDDEIRRAERDNL